MTSTELAVRENGRHGRDWIELLEPAAALANQVAGTGFVPRSMQGNPAAIVAAVLYGDELGLGPMQSLAKISVIEGKPTLSAEAQRALILAAGHELRVDDATATKFTLAGRRVGSTEWTSVTWTLDDAKRANIAGKSNWRLYPRQMLAARATAELARLLFADVIGGLAATEEIDDVDEFALPLAIAGPGTPEKKTTKRRRKTPATVVTPAEGAEDAGSASPALPPLPDEPAETLLEPAPDADTGTVTDPDSAPEPEPPERRVESPSDAELGDNAEDAGEVVDAQDDETTASSGTSSEDVASPAQLKALDRIVGTYRETEVELADGSKSAVLSTEQLWAAAATRRNVEVEVMIELLGGRDSDGVLHWSPLRDSLTTSEASDLIAKLEDHGRRWGIE